MFNVKGTQPVIRTEIIAGVTTFLTMAYVMVVNPLVLSQGGVPFEQAFTATIIATLAGTLLMAFFANYPIAIAPGMGLNAYFTYSLALTHKGMDYHVAFSAVFISAILFVILSLTPLRSKLIEIIPDNLKHAIGAGIGLFIAFIGLRLTGLVKADPSTIVTLGDLHTLPVILAIIGLVVTLIFMVLNIRGALFIGMLVTGIIAYFTGQIHFTKGIVSLPNLPAGLVAYNPITAVSDIIHYGLYGAVFSFLLVTLFDTTGTILGLGKQAGLMEGEKLPRAERALFADSAATLIGSIFGTSPTSAYLESAAGISAGGRTGLTALVVAILFAIAAFFTPIISAISGVEAITGPALIIVGSLMISNVRHIIWDNDEAFPAFLVILAMPLTSSIATGLALGFIFYPLLKVVRGKWREVHPLIYIFGLLFLIQLAFFQH
ncbi:guanine permease [Dictyobacter vulcani]|uniref:Guanine permease n=1 Tax=Dictyobacter vulcani TaxID=2607529 RepID=A0A5J4KUX8_9CHLR|nr:NCS2 family permease [Dictyobacter vulcani]GER90301.1 guanine permease [Dictyobacter vulcani]